MTYEYHCTFCAAKWEAEQRITEKPLTDCPMCEEPTAQRLISGAAFVLKGGAWAKDGYAR